MPFSRALLNHKRPLTSQPIASTSFFNHLITPVAPKELKQTCSSLPLSPFFSSQLLQALPLRSTLNSIAPTPVALDNSSSRSLTTTLLTKSALLSVRTVRSVTTTDTVSATLRASNLMATALRVPVLLLGLMAASKCCIQISTDLASGR
ncbi:hypothetical protein CCHR01_00231 [Colletotrichum chrysophilum]|uniref:Uncharacterized protein n=1 Tax=Colletotrichum chrysophilum TaxID=1836956 RepID=A0AAD9B0B8_9PEZI|nr:hypothetical protein CCHR01_00231 [Colletotrichum chrysophilum]